MNDHNQITSEEFTASIDWLLRDGCNVVKDESGRYVAEWPSGFWLLRRKHGKPHEHSVHAIREGRRATGDLNE